MDIIILLGIQITRLLLASENYGMFVLRFVSKHVFENLVG